MDDLNARLDRLLEDPNLSDKINSVLSSLSGDGGGAPEEHGQEEGGLPELSGLLSSVDPGQLMRIMGALGGGGQGDDRRLLSALAPYLRPSRRRRVEEAGKLMAVFRLLPMLTDNRSADKKPEK